MPHGVLEGIFQSSFSIRELSYTNKTKYWRVDQEGPDEDFNIHLIHGMKLRRSNHQRLKNLHLEAIKRQTKTYDWEKTFVEGGGTIVILAADSFILTWSQNPLIWRWINIKKCHNKITHSGEDKNYWRINRLAESPHDYSDLQLTTPKGVWSFQIFLNIREISYI